MSELDLAGVDHARDGSVQPDRSSNDLCLVMPITESTWLGRDPDGRSVTARRLADSPDPVDSVDLKPADPKSDSAVSVADVPATDPPATDPPATDAAGVIERARELMALRAPSLVPVLGVQRWDRSLWLVSELDHGVSLSRLLELTRPTPAQAVFVGLGVVCGVRVLHAADLAHGRVSAAEVRVGDDGRVRLDGWAGGIVFGSTVPLDGRQRADIAALGVLLTDLAAAARRAPPGTEQRGLTMLAALDAAADYAALPGADVELVAGPLAAVWGPDQDAAVRSELAALVVALTASGSAPAWGSPARSAQTVASASPSPSAPGTVRESWTARLGARLGAGLRGVWLRTWTWVVALAVLMGAVSVEFVLLHDRLMHDMHLLLGGDQPQRTGADSPGGPMTAALPPVREPAPMSAGIVDGLDLRALEPCTPGAACVVRVLVRLQPQPEPQTVAWTFQVVDRCTDSLHNGAGGVVSVAPGGSQAQAVSTVPLPPGQALALIAVTSDPARAASRPLLVPARPGPC